MFWIVGPLVVAPMVAVALLRIFARRVVGLRLNPPKVDVVSAEPGRITFKSDKYTSAEGAYSIGWGDAAVTKIGQIESKGHGAVVRTVSLDSPLPPSRSTVTWLSSYFTDPCEVGEHEDVQLQTEVGVAPAWYFPGAPSSTDWIIHVHGLRVTRSSPLRAVDSLRRTGAHSLVISYRGDTEGPAHPSGSSTLGSTEWSDIEPAITYARTHGARRVFLMGWSMGAAMVLLASERASNRNAIDGVILVGPVTDWRAVIVHGARVAGLPTVVAKALIAGLSRDLTARLLGAGGRIDFDSLDWNSASGRVNRRCLVLHSATDDEVPFELSERFARVNPSVVLAVQPDALHTLEWNRSRDSFEESVASWISNAG